MTHTAKHTPGPWSVEPLESTGGADMAICAPSCGWVVAVVQHDPDIQATDNPDSESVVWHNTDLANAHLIAEAPAMLEALREFTGAVDAGTTFADQSVIDLARAILARIDGNGEA